MEDLTARAEAAEGKLDIIKRRLEGKGDDELAIDYGGTKWEEDPTVRAVEELKLRAQMELLQMQRVQLEDPIHLYEMKGRSC